MTDGEGNVQPRLQGIPGRGVNPFVAANISNVSIERISLGVLPLLIPYVLMIALLVFVSDWVTFLPDLVYGKRAF